MRTSRFIQIFLYITNLPHFTTGLEFAVETLKSFILSMALIDNHLTVEAAVHLSRLELEFQVVHCFLTKDFTFPALCMLYEA